MSDDDIVEVQKDIIGNKRRAYRPVLSYTCIVCGKWWPWPFAKRTITRHAHTLAELSEARPDLYKQLPDDHPYKGDF